MLFAYFEYEIILYSNKENEENFLNKNSHSGIINVWEIHASTPAGDSKEYINSTYSYVKCV